MTKVTREKFKVFEGVFDNSTLDTLTTLKQRKYYDVLSKAIKTGKEGDVYLAEKNIDEENIEYRAIKMYRVTSANFKKISQYINRDFRFKTIKGNLRKVIMVWASKEFRNLNLCHGANMNVPYPYKQQNNVLIMEYIPGLMLKDTPLENPEEFFELLMEQLHLMRHSAKLIHGDLSEFNILVKDQIPYIIDLGQAMSIKNYSDFKDFEDLYIRDITNVVGYFNKKYKLELDIDEIFKRLEQE